MCGFSTYVAFDKATNGQRDIKHEMGEKISSMSLLKIVGEKRFQTRSLRGRELCRHESSGLRGGGKAGCWLECMLGWLIE